MPYKHIDASFLHGKLKIQNKSPFCISILCGEKEKSFKGTFFLGSPWTSDFFFVSWSWYYERYWSKCWSDFFFFTCTYFKMRDSFKGPKHFLWWPFLILVGNPHCFDEVSPVAISELLNTVQTHNQRGVIRQNIWKLFAIALHARKYASAQGLGNLTTPNPFFWRDARFLSACRSVKIKFVDIQKCPFEQIRALGKHASEEKSQIKEQHLMQSKTLAFDRGWGDYTKAAAAAAALLCVKHGCFLSIASLQDSNGTRRHASRGPLQGDSALVLPKS